MKHNIKIIPWPTFEKTQVYADMQKTLANAGVALVIRYGKGGDLKVSVQDNRPAGSPPLQ